MHDRVNRATVNGAGAVLPEELPGMSEAHSSGQSNLWSGLHIVPQRTACKDNKKADVRTTGLAITTLKITNVF